MIYNYLFFQSFQTNFAKVESLLGSEDGNNNSLANVLRDTESNIIGKFSIFKVEKILKSSLNSIQSPSLSVKIQMLKFT